MLKKLPIGLQTFSELIENNYVYIDKTEYAYNMINSGKIYFLSRPRRFGKSLFLSTLKSIFEGKKELFEDLCIYNTDYDWQEYPIIHLDMGGISNKVDTRFETLLMAKILDIANNFKIEIQHKDKNSAYVFEELIKGLAEKFEKKVVILIDEYDKPILDQINNLEIAEKNRDILASFYNVLKVQDENLHFVFITGVTKFSKVSIFSGMNSPEDITMSSDYSSLLGYTQEELENYFDPYIEKLAESEELSKQKTLAKMKEYYNGYNFSENAISVYNPFSVLNLLKSQRFFNHWYASGTPTFLMKMMREENFKIYDVENTKLKAHEFNKNEIGDLDLPPLLYQTGYLTIKEYNKEDDIYFLTYPNREVKESFLESILSDIPNYRRKIRLASTILEFRDALRDKDFDLFFLKLYSFFSNIQYDISPSSELEIESYEYYYQSIFFVIFELLGFSINCEVKTNIGRIDAVIEIGREVFIFEFKLNGTKDDALSQIKKMEYFSKYITKGKKSITLIGAEFDRDKKNIKNDGYVIEEVTAESLLAEMKKNKV